MQPAVFLDRDNTLIDNDGDLGDPSGVRLKPGVPEGLRALREAGFRLVVVTNQGGVARGVYAEHDVDAVHQRIAQLVDTEARDTGLIDRFYYCPYHPDASVDRYRREHPWRKPNPGMLLQAAHDLDIDLDQSWLIGDQPRDVSAGQNAGCRTVLIGGQEVEVESSPTAVVETFPAAVDRILQAPQETDPESPSTNPEAKSVETARGPVVPARETDLAKLRTALRDLTEELQTERMRRIDFTPVKMMAAFCQLLVVLLALQGLLHLSSPDVFLQWMAPAILAQLFTLTLLVLDLKT